MKGKHVSAISDRTTRLREVLVIVLRFVHEWSVCQHLVHVSFLQKSLNSEELARQIISVLSATLGVDSDKLVAVMRDGASVNTAAIRFISVMYSVIVDIRCLSHTLHVDLVGEKFRAVFFYSLDFFVLS